MNRHIIAVAALAVAAGLATGLPAGAQEAKTYPEPAGFDAAAKTSWSKVKPDEWKTRIETDETQRLCNLYRNNPPPDVARKIMEMNRATVVYPADGQVIGDWKKGQALANNGRGGQFSDEPNTVNGGNCYACHQLDPKEVSFGTLGPSLTGYGKARDFSPDAAKEAYAKIYNAQAAFACTNMPRFGATRFLSEQQMKDAVALLFSRDSPVNK
ncbi:sulfur oxidation c-type cytochrome SoxX [Prosthecodimorpha staleyi]|uniref:Sulfur oxidation c-type cytochrome SoxX n=1 Tax=Prosthecodimorpha staleyi TaxID=2840188 RepID=A0A947D7B3_9HYPH|nr:sulfur oxidation c-type cytochrome SoxX [Prosthecodimorpha staleyi]MBT9289527.1 sulfur oxidation c-type cytochrome SoxX [Prosthecodimorpha staleyi]